MKSNASNTTHCMFHQLCQRVALSRTLGDAYGAGIMSHQHKRETHRAGWTTEQLLTMANAKSWYN